MDFPNDNSLTEDNYNTNYLEVDNNQEQDNTDLGFDDIEADIFGWKRKKKKKKKKGKWKKFRHFLFGKYHKKKDKWSNSSPSNDEKKNFVDNDKSKIDKNVDTLFKGYEDIQSGISPNQEADITRFLQNINSPPKMFNFDIDSYLAKNPNTDNDRTKTNNLNAIHEPKAFFQFGDNNSPLLSQNGDAELSASNMEKVDDIKPMTKIDKRDLMKQRLEAIYNKIKMFQPIHMPIEMEREIHQNEKNRNEIIHDLSTMKDNRLLDKNVDLLKSAELINTRDLDIDLDLDKKFRDFNIMRKDDDSDNEKDALDLTNKMEDN